MIIPVDSIDVATLAQSADTIPMAEFKSNKIDTAQWLDEYGNVLYRFALQRVGQSDVAEDLVQETFVAALRAADGFQGRSEVKTWLISILRNKITDHLRKTIRHRKHQEHDRAEQEPTTFQNGKWLVGLKKWRRDPAKSMENSQFWRVVDHCMEKLPAKLGAAFRMRDLEELSMADICNTLDITPTNLSVRLHRARILLRECLDRNWFSAEGPS